MKTSQVEESWHPKMQFSNFHPPPVSLSLVGSGKLEFVATPQVVRWCYIRFYEFQ